MARAARSTWGMLRARDEGGEFLGCGCGGRWLRVVARLGSANGIVEWGGVFGEWGCVEAFPVELGVGVPEGDWVR